MTHARAGKALPRPGVPLALTVAGAFLVALAVLALFRPAAWLATAVYLVLSILAFLMYRGDKRAAEAGARRTPEEKLHAVALLGGWPGAFVAQRMLRHKTVKQPFQAIFWGTVAVNVTVLAWLLFALPIVV